jgi:ABC-type transport system substrate-binding protein
MNFKSILFVTCLILSACGSGSNKKQFEFAGGCLTLSVDNEPSTHIARDVTDVYSNTVLTQVMEGLVSFNPEDLTVQPQLAKKWSVSADGTQFTFELRDDVYFHEHPVFLKDEDRKMTAEDVQFTIEKACLPNSKGEASSAYLSLFNEQLVGATAYFERKANNIAGLSIKGNKVQLTLMRPDLTYINKLAQINAAIVSKKVVKANKEADLIGTGPFKYTDYVQGEPGKIILTKNQSYYLNDAKGNALPYLDSVVFIVEPRKLEQLELFEKGQTQVINTLPTSRIAQMLEGRIKDFNSEPPLMVLYNNPLLFTNYYFFNMTDPRFQDPKVRQAFNFAINRDRLTNEVLRGQFYETGIYGIVPPISSTFKGYDFKGVKQVGYNFDPEKARALLAEAGYPGGKGFGSVNLRVNIGDIHSAVAEEISDEIYQVLGINVNIDGSSFEQKDADADFARGDLFRTAWVADYSSPETFLANFYGKLVPKTLSEASQINQSRYVNPNFDRFFEQARQADTQKMRYELYSKAEQELLKNPPLMVLWYANDFQLSYSRVRNLKNNPMNLIDLKKVYLKEWTKEEYLKSIR